MAVSHEPGIARGRLAPSLPLSPTPGAVPVWLRVWAVFTACAALPLVTLGAEVTTKRVGMVDSQGFRAPWHLFTLPPDQLTLGILIEHGHRLAGFVVGIACIVLAVGMTLQARGWFHRSLGWVALIAVGLQGLLGIFRVDRNAAMGPELAMIHGCCAQLVFAVLVGVAVCASRAWNAPVSISGVQKTTSLPSSLRTGSLALGLLVYTQIVFGAGLRHLLNPLAQRLHVLLAFAVLLTVFWLVQRSLNNHPDPATRRIALLLLGLVLLQPILGVEAWIRRFGSGELPELMHSTPTLDFVRSGHHVLGTLIFATTVALALMLNRRPDAISECAAHDAGGAA